MIISADAEKAFVEFKIIYALKLNEEVWNIRGLRQLDEEHLWKPTVSNNVSVPWGNTERLYAMIKKKRIFCFMPASQHGGGGLINSNITRKTEIWYPSSKWRSRIISIYKG